MMLNALTETVRLATGIPDAQPRPGQALLTQHIEEAINNTGHVVGIAPTGVGKALDVDTPIATPFGWTTMGQLQDGDQVFAEDGAVCNVVKAHDFQYDRPCYSVKFSDGSSIVADEEHLWSVSTRAMRARAVEIVRGQARYNSAGYHERLLKLKAARENIELSGYEMTSGDAALLLQGLADITTINKARKDLGGARLSRGQKFDLRPVLDHLIAVADTRSLITNEPLEPNTIMNTGQMIDALVGQGGARNLAIDVAGALQMPDREDLLLSPYVLGAWLGDGTSCRGQITSADSEIPSHIEQEGLTVTKLAAPYLYSLHLGAGPVNSGYSPNVTGLLRQLGVLSDKHIPTRYLRAAISQRLELLQGLMDTDGTIRPDGRSEIALSNEKLALGVFELVCSLGIKATYKAGPAAITEDDPENPGQKRRRIVGTRYRIGFVTDLPVFRMKRKAALLPTKVRSTQLRRYIVSIDAVESRPVRCILVDSPSHLFLAGKSMVPTHNTFSLLAPAMVAAAELGQRTIISTESLSLLAQIIDKDAPKAADACHKLTGTRPEVAMLKGFSNYVCLQAVQDVAEAVTDLSGTRPGKTKLLAKLKRMKATGTSIVDGRTFDNELGLPLLIWALSLSDDDAGDKQTYEGNLTNELWDMISVGPSECIGQTCPLFDYCKPRKAKAKAADADIVVTNHSMLAVQAAKGVPVLVGNATLGEFHIIMVDEAHTLPDNVRNAGACEVSAASVLGLTKSIGRVLDETDREVENLIDAGSALAIEVNQALDKTARGTRDGDVCRLGEGDDPLEDMGEALIAWGKSVKNALEAAVNSSQSSLRIKAKRLTGRFDTFIANVGSIKLHRTGTARWIELRTPHKDSKNTQPYWVSCASPVNISGMLTANLWNAPVLPDPEDETVQAMKEAGEPIDEEVETYPMTVIAVSATLPGRFGYQIGLTAENVDYPSPFDMAYGSSLLFIPKPTVADNQKLYPGWFPGDRKPRFDVRAHREWAAEKNVELVNANGGSALILAATSESGKAYAAALRRAAYGRWNVLSQWDGLSTRQLISTWREDVPSVLVGTRSLMTGVDAPGRTCSLVSVDRIPRAASNPVGDARVEAIMESMQIDKWSADRFVYVQDAALLLEQAAGRLIRSMKDVGMLAVLDPRFLKSGAVSYPEPTRLIYKKSVARFTTVTTDQAVAEQFLNKISATQGVFMAA